MGSSIGVGIVYGFVVDTDGGTSEELEEYLAENFPKVLDVVYTGDMYHDWSIPIIHIKNAGVNSWSCYKEISEHIFEDRSSRDVRETLSDVHTNLVDMFSGDEYGPKVGNIGWILYGNYG